MGLDAGLQTIAYSFSSPNLTASNSWIEPYIKMPVMLNPRFVVHNKHVIGFQAGAALHYFVPVSYNAEYHGTGTDLFDLNFTLVKSNPYIQPELGMTYGVVLKNMNIIEFDLHYSIGTKMLVNGQYTWRDIDVIKERGKVQSQDNYISVGFHYIFTRAVHLKQNMADNKLEPLEEK